MKSGRRRARMIRRVVVALGLSGMATLLSPSPPTAATGGAFRGVAAAEGIRVGVSAVGAPVTNSVVDGAGPIAQAALDSTSGSSALASVAYPGDLVVTTPGLLAGVSGGQLSGVPPYPLLATAGSTTTPEQKVDGPGSTMRAAAADRRAEATARSGIAPLAEGGPAAWATSSVVEADDAGVVTSLALSDATGVTIGPLTLGRVTARSLARRAPGADPTRETTFEATGVSVGGHGVALTSAGLVVAGRTTPVSASPLQPVLDAAGISIRPVAAETTPDGVVSAGLVVSRTQELPTAISPVTVTYTFGRALAAVSPAAPAPVGSVDPIAPITEPGPPSDQPGGSSVSGVALPATVSGTGSVGGGGAIAGAGSTPGADTAAGAGTGDTAAGAGQPAATGTAMPIRRVGTRLFDLSAIYLLLVAAAATAGAVIQLVRRPGVG